MKVVPITPPQPPAPPPERAYADFDHWMSASDYLAKHWRTLSTRDDEIAAVLIDARATKTKELVRLVSDVWWPNDLAARLATFADGLPYYNGRAELHDSGGTIGARFVTEQVGLLVGSFPNIVAHNPQVYSGMLRTEIAAANPTPVALEAACRIIRRTQKFPPAIADMIALLREQDARFAAACEASDAERWDNLEQSLREGLADLRAELAKRGRA